jgi:hypothetical protein
VSPEKKLEEIGLVNREARAHGNIMFSGQMNSFVACTCSLIVQFAMIN